MQTKPAISVLVPIYNVERYLRECLASLAVQTFTDFEVICINDGSTDGSRAIIQEFMDADGRFTVIDKSNSGYGCSMNLGLARCTGTYVTILESDDFVDPEAFKTMYDLAECNDADVVKCDFYLYWSQPARRNQPFNWVDERIEGVVNPQVEREVFYRKPSIWSALYRRDFLDAHNIRFLETPGASYQDAAFNFKVWASATTAVLTRRAFLHYRQDNEASSVNSPGKVFCVCDEYAEMCRYVQENYPDQDYLWGILAAMRYDTYIWNYERLSDELKAQFLPRMVEDYRQEDAEGHVDPNVFDPGKFAMRGLTEQDPELFALLKRSEQTGIGRRHQLMFCLKEGGFFAALRLIRQKFSRR